MKRSEFASGERFCLRTRDTRYATLTTVFFHPDYTTDLSGAGLVDHLRDIRCSGVRKPLDAMVSYMDLFIEGAGEAKLSKCETYIRRTQAADPRRLEFGIVYSGCLRAIDFGCTIRKF